MSAAAQVISSQFTGESKTTRRPGSFSNIALWTLQVLLGIFFSFTGFGKVLCLNHTVWHMMRSAVPWFSAVPQGLFVFIGVSEFLGGVALIAPAVTGIKPKLTPLAGFSLAVVMILAAGFHIARAEYAFYLPINFILAAGAAFLWYGRGVVKPIAPRPIGAFRVVFGLALLCALAVGGAAPVWLQVRHIH